MNSTIQRNYSALRRYWHEPAKRALQMAKDHWQAQQAGITFDWEPEQESPRDVFGNPSYYECGNCGTSFFDKGDCPGCNEPQVTFHDTGVYYDPTAEFYTCVAKGPNGEVLDSLGMIDGAFDRSGLHSYAWHVECEMAGDALSQLDTVIGSNDYEPEDTLA